MDKTTLLKRLAAFSKEDLQIVVIEIYNREMNNIMNEQQQDFVQGMNHMYDIGSEVLGSQGAKGIKAYRILSKEESRVEADRIQITNLLRGYPMSQINSANTAWLKFRRSYDVDPRFKVGIKGKKRLALMASIISDSTVYTLEQIMEKLNSSDRKGKITMNDVVKHKRDILDKL